MFKAIAAEADRKFNTGGKAMDLLKGILALMTDETNDGIAGIVDRFRANGLGDLIDSWIGSGTNTPISKEQTESAIGENNLNALASRAGLDYDTTVAATAEMLPRVVDELTPTGMIPTAADLTTRISGLAAAPPVAEVFDRVDPSAEIRGIDSGNLKTDGVPGIFPADEEENSPLKWLLPLIILIIMIVLGYWFCGGKSEPVATVKTVTNANTNANTNTYPNTVTNSNVAVVTNNNENTNTIIPANENRKLTEVALPGGVKLQAYPNGIEDQLIKFIESDEYKNGTADSLKNKWFNFDDLNFKFGTTELVPESKRQLDNIVAILKAFPDVKIKIGGYTDKKGDDVANKKLSDDRAKAVKIALEKAGVGAQVPEAEGYGEEFATVPETATDADRAPDRKTSIRLLK